MADPTPLQALILWALVARGGEALQKDLRPEPDKKARDALVALGLIAAERRGRTRATFLELTDKGWAWAGDNMRVALSTRSTAGAVVLADLLARLQAFLAASHFTLADVIRPAPVATGAGEPPAAAPAGGTAAREVHAELPDRIRAAYLEATGGALKRRVRLAELQEKLADVPPHTWHAALLAMQAHGGAVLLRQEDPTRLTAEDHAAALRVGGEPRHFLWLD